MIDHSASCSCLVCQRSADITQADRDLLADLWARWCSARDGEAVSLRSGSNGAIGSPRWVALKAIAAARRGGLDR